MPSKEEISTSINLMGNENDWELYTDDTTIMTKLRKVGLESYKQNNSGGFWYKIPKNRISFRSENKRKPLTKEQKAANIERLKKARLSKQEN